MLLTFITIILLYRPLYIPYQLLITFEGFNVCSNITADSKASILRYILRCPHIVFNMSSLHQLNTDVNTFAFQHFLRSTQRFLRIKVIVFVYFCKTDRQTDMLFLFLECCYFFQIRFIIDNAVLLISKSQEETIDLIKGSVHLPCNWFLRLTVHIETWYVKYFFLSSRLCFCGRRRSF